MAALQGKSSDESAKIIEDFAQLARLSATADRAEVRIYLARLVRRYRSTNPDLSERLDKILRQPEVSTNDEPAKREARRDSKPSSILWPSDPGPDLSLLRRYEPRGDVEAPILADDVKNLLDDLVEERRHQDLLVAQGLRPISSAIFVGPPGVGKTHAAKWLSQRLNMPLFSLDLTSVMSSLLGKSGANLRSALDYARRVPSILFLDEIDSIGKSRSDQTDIGELKRLVTILLQELDEWPSTSIVLAATNHPELVDMALWRRFDQVVYFPMPTPDLALESIRAFLGANAMEFEPFIAALASTAEGRSFSDLKGMALALRKHVVLGRQDAVGFVGRQVAASVEPLSKSERIQVAIDLTRSGKFSQHDISRMTSVSRDTIRKYAKPEGKE